MRESKKHVIRAFLKQTIAKKYKQILKSRSVPKTTSPNERPENNELEQLFVKQILSLKLTNLLSETKRVRSRLVVQITGLIHAKVINWNTNRYSYSPNIRFKWQFVWAGAKKCFIRQTFFCDAKFLTKSFGKSNEISNQLKSKVI
jgi:hypothetical protein